MSDEVPFNEVARTFLANVSAKLEAVQHAATGNPTPGELTAFAHGQLEGEQRTWALVVSILTERAVTDVLQEATAQAKVEQAHPVDFDFTAGAIDIVQCPRLGCNLSAEVLAPIPHSVLKRAVCLEGHETSLAPNVLEHLLRKAKEEERGAA